MKIFKYLLITSLLFCLAKPVFADNIGILIKGGPWIKSRVGGVGELFFDLSNFADWAKDAEVGIGAGYGELTVSGTIIKLVPIFVDLYLDLSKALFLKEDIRWKVYAGGGLNLPVKVSFSMPGYLGSQYFLGVSYKFNENNLIFLEGGKTLLAFLNSSSVLVSDLDFSLNFGYKISL
jgi:hypothetical protein